MWNHFFSVQSKIRRLARLSDHRPARQGSDIKTGRPLIIRQLDEEQPLTQAVTDKGNLAPFFGLAPTTSTMPLRIIHRKYGAFAIVVSSNKSSSHEDWEWVSKHCRLRRGCSCRGWCGRQQHHRWVRLWCSSRRSRWWERCCQMPG